MALGDLLLNTFRDRDGQREEEDRRRRRRHRSHRHSYDPEYRTAHPRRSRRDDSDVYNDRREDYDEPDRPYRREGDYAPSRRSTVNARRPVTRNEDATRAPAALRPSDDGRRRRRHVSMRRRPSTASSSTFDDRDTPPSTPGSVHNSKGVQQRRPHVDRSRPQVQARGSFQNRTDNSTDEDYSQLRPGKRELRTGHTAGGAHGTDFMVGVPSDIGSLPSESGTELESEPEPESAGRGVHLKIITKPAPEDKEMTGALAPGTAPYRRVGPPTSQPLISRTNSKQDSVFSQMLRPSPHHDNLKRRSTVSNRPKRRTTTKLPSPKTQSPNMTHATPSVPPMMVRRRATAPVVPTRSEKAPAAPPEPEPTLECLTCCDDIPISKAAKLDCEHVMCGPCLKRVFELSVTDPAHMPPKCCTEAVIPLRFVAPLLDNKFKLLWNKKFQEFSTKDRMYCPKKGCGEWIQPRDQKLDRVVGRRFGVCAKCKTKVCKKCNNRWHGSKDCQNDEETKQLLDTAKKEGWQRCYSCKAMVQLAEGCNHMKCRCTAEFCMICGSKWKTCDCPWFNTPPENDPMAGLFFPPNARFLPRVRVRAGQNGGPPRPFLDPGAPRAQGYAAHMDARRAQEQEDEELARRLQMDDFDDGPNPFHHLVERNRGMAGGAAGAIGAVDLITQFARIVIEGANEAQQEMHQRQIRLGRNARVQAGWMRSPRRATVNERSRAGPPAPAPEPPAAVESDYNESLVEDEGLAWNELDRIRGRQRRASDMSALGGASAADMAGLSQNGRRGRDRVGGWLEHIAGGGPQHHEV